MKKVFIAAFCTLTLVSCDKSLSTDSTSAGTDNAIQFEFGFSETKISQDNSQKTNILLLDGLKQFNYKMFVYGGDGSGGALEYEATADAKISRPTEKNIKGFRYSTTEYEWPKEEKYLNIYACAYGADDVSSLTVDYSDNQSDTVVDEDNFNVKVTDFVVPCDISEQQDLVIAAAAKQHKNINRSSCCVLRFKHMLNHVNVSLTNCSTKDTVVEIVGARLLVNYNKGCLLFNSKSTNSVKNLAWCSGFDNLGDTWGEGWCRRGTDNLSPTVYLRDTPVRVGPGETTGSGEIKDILDGNQFIVLPQVFAPAESDYQITGAHIALKVRVYDKNGDNIWPGSDGSEFRKDLPSPLPSSITSMYTINVNEDAQWVHVPINYQAKNGFRLSLNLECFKKGRGLGLDDLDRNVLASEDRGVSFSVSEAEWGTDYYFSPIIEM